MTADDTGHTLPPPLQTIKNPSLTQAKLGFSNNRYSHLNIWHCNNKNTPSICLQSTPSGLYQIEEVIARS